MTSPIAFLGTPEIAVPSLVALHDAGFPIDVVVTAPDARRSRRGAPTPTPVRREADRRGIPVVFDEREVANRTAALGVVVAFGRIIPQEILDVVPMVNLHFSLLPRWRGAAPVEHAILSGDEETGVCVMGVEAGLDTGPVHAVARTPVGDKTRDELWDELAHTGARLLVETLRSGLGPGTPQAGDVTVAPKLTAADRHIDWASSATRISRVVRLSGAWTTVCGKRLAIVKATAHDDSEGGDAGRATGAVTRDPADGDVAVRCGEGALHLEVVRPEGRSDMDAASWLNGLRSSTAVRLGT